MGNSCCFNGINNYEKNIYLDSDSFNRRKNELNTKKSTTNSVFEKYKSDDNCSILINGFNKDINYIVSYKESEEKKKFKQKNK
jgi:hypothetical protein